MDYILIHFGIIPKRKVRKEVAENAEKKFIFKLSNFQIELAHCSIGTLSHCIIGTLKSLTQIQIPFRINLMEILIR